MLIPTFLFLYNKPIKLKDSKMKKVRAKALYIARYLKAFVLTERQVCIHKHPGRCPFRARSFCPFGRVGFTCET